MRARRCPPPRPAPSTSPPGSARCSPPSWRTSTGRGRTCAVPGIDVTDPCRARRAPAPRPDRLGRRTAAAPPAAMILALGVGVGDLLIARVPGCPLGAAPRFRRPDADGRVGVRAGRGTAADGRPYALDDRLHAGVGRRVRRERGGAPGRSAARRTAPVPAPAPAQPRPRAPEPAAGRRRPAPHARRPARTRRRRPPRTSRSAPSSTRSRASWPPRRTPTRSRSSTAARGPQVRRFDGDPARRPADRPRVGPVVRRRPGGRRLVRLAAHGGGRRRARRPGRGLRRAPAEPRRRAPLRAGDARRPGPGPARPTAGRPDHPGSGRRAALSLRGTGAGTPRYA